MSTTWYTKLKEKYSAKNLDAYTTDDYYWGVSRTDNNAGYRELQFWAIKKQFAKFDGGTYGYVSNNGNNKAYGIPFDSNTMFAAENYPTSYVYVSGLVDVNCNLYNVGDYGNPFDDRFNIPHLSFALSWVMFVPVGTNTNIFFSTAPFLPPEDYAGQIPPQSAVEPVEDIIVRPTGVYSVEDRKFNLLNAYTLRQSIEMAYPSYPKVFNVPDGYVSYIITKCDDNFNNCQTIKSESNVLVSSKIEYQFDDYGKYAFTYGYTFPSVVPKPASPEGTELKYDVQSFQLNIDGTSYTGNPTDGECTDGFCPSPSPYEDCSTYGTDVVGGLGCVMRNFGVLLKVILTNLFVPNSTFLKEYQANLTGFFNEKLGFLATSAGFITGLFSSIISGAANTSCTITPSGTFFGSSFTIDVCTFQRITAGGFAAIQTLIIGLTSVALFFAGLRKYHEVVDRR